MVSGLGIPDDARRRNQIPVYGKRYRMFHSTPRCRDAEPRYHQKVNNDLGLYQDSIIILWRTVYRIDNLCKAPLTWPGGLLCVRAPMGDPSDEEAWQRYDVSQMFESLMSGCATILTHVAA